MERITAEKIAKSIKDQSDQRNKAAFTPFWLCSFLLFAIFSAVPALAETPPELFKSGNAAYAAGKFSEAVSSYEAAQKQGLQNWVLAYNLGNAFFKSGQLGKAIVNYHRALRLNPGQRDVMYNLELASTKAGDPLLPAGALTALFWQIFFFFSLNTLTFYTSLFFVAFCAAALLALLGRFILRVDVAVFLGGLFLIAGSWLGARAYFDARQEAVVTTSIAEVRSGPNTSYPTNFTIPEGRRVLVLGDQEPVSGWIEIGVPQEGLKGWVPETSVEVINGLEVPGSSGRNI